MDERDRVTVEPEEPVRRETTVISTGDGGGGGGGVIAAIVLVLALALLAFLFFGGYFERAADEVDVNVNVDAPEVQLPDVEIPEPSTEPSQPSEPGNNG